jgi:hypothetical protein
MVGCTVITARYAPYARVLGRSFLEHHPSARLEVEPDFDTLRPHDVGVDDAELHRRAVMYDGQGLTCSMKPALLRHLIDQGEDAAVLLDADSRVYGDLEPLPELARRHGTVMTPHSTVPHEDIELDRLIIRTGAFNTGLLAVGEGARPFLDWWDERTARRCIPKPGSGVFNEQAWLNLVPGLFDHHVLRDPGVNATGFAMHYRDVVWKNGAPTFPDGPLRHFHFLCGFDPHRPELLTTDPTIALHWPPLEERPGLARLAGDYAQRLLAAGYEEARRADAPFDALPNGLLTTPLMRSLYREAVIGADSSGDPEPPNPWECAGPDPFLAWLNEPAGDGAPSRYLLALWAERPDLQAAFPDVPGADAAAFLGWAADKPGAEDDHIPAALAPPQATIPAAATSLGPQAARELASEHGRLARDFDVLRRSRSWRLTAPVRGAARRVRAARARPPRPSAGA